MEPPLVSIIIPVYNHANRLEKTIDTLLSQSYRPLEIIVVNDGSTDNFSEVIERIKIKKSDLNFKVSTQTNQGAPAARNAGFKMANGEYVLFCDADVLAKPYMIQKMFEALGEHPEVSYAYCPFYFGWKKMKSQPFNPEDLKKNNYIVTTSLIRREAVIDISGPFDESLKRFQDWDLWLTLLEKGRVGIFIPEVLFKIVVKKGGISSWLPSFMYRIPWKTAKVKRYEEAKEIVLRKHML